VHYPGYSYKKLRRMSAPNLTVKVEPAENSSVVYGALAAKTSNDAPEGQLSLVLTIINNEQGSVHLNQVTVSFVGPPNLSPSSIPADLTIFPAQSKQWYFVAANNIILPVPAPGVVKLSLHCDGFDEPANVSLPLAQYVSPAEGGGYSFPARTGDLKRGEHWTGRSAAHGAAGGGTQLFAYDLLVRAFDATANTWPTTSPGSDATKNASYYIWGKPIYAMADGVVKQFLDGAPANTPPNLPSPTLDPVEGNHFYIQHGDDLALYAHFQAGTLNPVLTSGPNSDGTGAAVARGQLLGLAGNSGNSSEPHLHIQVNRTTTPWGGPPRPLPFNDIYVLDLSAVNPHAWPPNTDAPWTAANTQDLPSVVSAIWPGTLRLGRNAFLNAFYLLTWAWIIIIGGLMITPGGIECIVCGPSLTVALGIISIVLGALGVASRVIARPGAPAHQLARPQFDFKSDLHA
jgi:Peptidase family M23